VAVVDDTKIQVTITTSDYGYARDASGVCQVDTSYWQDDTTTLNLTVSGTPPSGFSGTYQGTVATVYPQRPELNDSMSYGGTTSGTLMASCPDPADPNVVSQEERGDPCR
jgi:hypothetical protein